MADPGDVRRRHQWPSVQSSRRVTERRNYREEVEKGGGGKEMEGKKKVLGLVLMRAFTPRAWVSSFQRSKLLN